MPARNPAPAIPAFTSTLALLQLVAGPEMMAAAMPILRERMALTPEKLAILLQLAVNPLAFVEKKDEAGVRGIHRETLKDYKDQGLFPEFIGAQALQASQ
jgi:hypothetical protein